MKPFITTWVDPKHIILNEKSDRERQVLYSGLVAWVMSSSLQPCGLQSARLLHPWDFPGKNTGVGCHFPLQGIFPTPDQTQVSCIDRQILYHCVTRKVTYRPHIILNGNVIEEKARSPYKHPINSRCHRHFYSSDI